MVPVDYGDCTKIAGVKREVGISGGVLLIASMIAYWWMRVRRPRLANPAPPRA